MQNQEQQALLAGLANLLGLGNQQQPTYQQTNHQSVGLPIGVYGCDHKGVFLAKSVNSLTSWEETVLCEDGGTCEGLKVAFINLKEQKKNDKAYSSRKGYMARFEVCRARGRNPLNEVINVFMKDQHSYVPYLDPRKWDNRIEIIDFRSLDDDKISRFRINIVTFDGEPISDDIHRKAQNVLDRLKGIYVYMVDGVEYDEDGLYGTETTETA